MEEVVIQSGNVQLNGMLVRPDTPGPHPAIVIFHGAGYNKPYSKWSYRILTNVFVRQGFAALSYDPYPFLTEIDIPMLYIMGGKDVNVPFDQSVTLLEQLKRELDKDITIKAYPEAGHYLYRWDWFPVEGFFVPGYLDVIVSWAGKQVK